MDDIFNLVLQHKWVAVAALIIGALTRLFKSDTRIPIDIPSRARVWFALGLGVIAGVLEKVSQGTPWTQAMLGGLAAASTAIITHNIVIDSMRGGREFVVPGLTKPGVPPGPGKPPSLPPPSMTIGDDDGDAIEDTKRDKAPYRAASSLPDTAFVPLARFNLLDFCRRLAWPARVVGQLSLIALMLFMGCKNPNTVNDVKTYTADALKVIDYLCVLNQSLEIDSAQAIATACNLDQQFAPVIEQLLAAQATNRAKFAQKHPNVCAPCPQTIYVTPAGKKQ